MSNTPPDYTAFLESLMGPPAEIEDEEVDLSTKPQSQWSEFDGSKVAPTAAIRRYLATDDVLTNFAIDMMEEAIEKAYQVPAGWFITSMRDGFEEAGNLKVSYFYLMQEA
jgi:hypothetical protein